MWVFFGGFLLFSWGGGGARSLTHPQTLAVAVVSVISHKRNVPDTTEGDSLYSTYITPQPGYTYREKK